MQLKGKVAYVTGAASGLGKAIAELYAKEGAAVAIADMNLDAAKAVAASIEASGGRAIGLACDVTDEAQVDASVEETVKALGSVEILVSNAGIQIVHPVQDFTFAEWKMRSKEAKLVARLQEVKQAIATFEAPEWQGNPS